MRTTWWKPTQWNAVCDSCGLNFKAEELRERWDGLMVCANDWETRHPQDLIKPIKDDPSVPWTRPAEDTITYNQDILEFPKYLKLPGTVGNAAQTPDSAVLLFPGNIEIIARVAATNYIPPSQQARIVAQNNVTGDQRGFYFDIYTDGSLVFMASTNGTADTTLVTSTVPISSLVSNQNQVYLKVNFIVDNGVGGNDVKFYYSFDGSSYTQLGTTITTAGTGPIFNTTAPLSIGINSPRSASFFSGNIYYIELRNGIDGPAVAKFDPTNDCLLPGQTSFVSSTGETWTIYQSGTSEVAVILGE